MQSPRCPLNHTKLAPLEPLTRDSDRTDVERRIAAPIATIVAINTIEDAYRSSDTQLSEAVERIEAKLELERWPAREGAAQRMYQETALAFTHALRSHVLDPLLDKAVDRFQHKSQWRPEYIDPRQTDILKSNVAIPRPVTGFVSEAVHGQIYTTFNIALPGYLIAKHGLEASSDVKDYVLDTGLGHISDTLQEPDFLGSLRRLAGTASGMLLKSQNPYVDLPEKHPVFDVKGALSQNEKACSIDPQDTPEPVTVYDLYSKNPDDSISLSTSAINALQYYLYFRNKSLEAHEKLGDVPGPSIGCPVVPKTARIRKEDLTQQQWTDLLEGEKPIATYDDREQRLTYKRQAIPELNQLFADVLAGKLA